MRPRPLLDGAAIVGVVARARLGSRARDDAREELVRDDGRAVLRAARDLGRADRVAAAAPARRDRLEREPALPGRALDRLRRRRRPGELPRRASTERVRHGDRGRAGLPARAAAWARHAPRPLGRRPRRRSALDRALLVPAHRGGRVPGVLLGAARDHLRGRAQAVDDGCCSPSPRSASPCSLGRSSSSSWPCCWWRSSRRRDWRRRRAPHCASSGGSRRPFVLFFGAVLLVVLAAIAIGKGSRLLGAYSVTAENVRIDFGLVQLVFEHVAVLALGLAILPFIVGVGWLIDRCRPSAVPGERAFAVVGCATLVLVTVAGRVLQPALRRRPRQGSLPLLRRPGGAARAGGRRRLA